MLIISDSLFNQAKPDTNLILITVDNPASNSLFSVNSNTKINISNNNLIQEKTHEQN